MYKSLLISALVFAGSYFVSIPLAQAQSKNMETISVELSNPDQKGSLRLHIHSGYITVIGQDRNDVEIGFINQENKNKEKNRGSLKLISSAATNMEISEYKNDIVVRTDNSRTDYKVFVPRNFDLSLSSHHNADIMVRNVIGELEIKSHHGGIEMEDVGGSVSAETHHGNILASFTSVDGSRPMAFSTYHGDVEITMPEGTNCRAKIKPGKGDIYTDFDLKVQPQQRQSTVDGKGAKEIKIGGWVIGDIGSGGKDFLFTTYHGDVIIRKS